MRPDPKFSVGEAVIVRSKFNPGYNSDFSIVTEVRLSTPYHQHLNGCFWAYKVHNIIINKKPGYTDSFGELSLHPIPKEENNGIDAQQYIKDLCTRSPEVVA